MSGQKSDEVCDNIPGPWESSERQCCLVLGVGETVSYIVQNRNEHHRSIGRQAYSCPRVNDLLR